jgi:hypothetical protein
MMLTMRYLLSKHSNLKVKNCCFEIKHNGDDSYDNRKTKRYSFPLIKMRQAFSRATYRRRLHCSPASCG